MKNIKKAEFARLVKTTRQKIQALCENGILTQLPDGTLELDAAQAAFAKHVADGSIGETQRLERHNAQMRKLKAQTDLLEIQRRQLEGDLMDRAEYVEARTIIITTCKNILLTLPARLGAPFPDVALKIEAHANEIVFDILTRLSDEGEYKDFGAEKAAFLATYVDPEAKSEQE